MEEVNNINNEKSNISKGENIISKENVFILIGSIILAVIYNILFYEKKLGVSYPVFVLVLYGVLLFTLRDKIEFKISFGTILTLPIIMLSLTYFFFSNWVFRVLNFMIIPSLIFVQTLLITNNNDYKWFDMRFLFDFLNAIFVRTLAHIFKPFNLVSEIIKRKPNSTKASVISKVVIGLIISVPLVGVVVGLLSEADQVFSHFVSNITDLFIKMNIGGLFAQLIIGFLVAIIAFSYLWSLYNKKDRNTSRVIEDSFKIKKIWDPIIIITILLSVNLIYVIFTAIQFTYLFGSIEALLPEGVTYAEYARRGFFELVAVTIINVSILISIINFTKNDNTIIAKILRILNSLLIVSTMVMLLSAHFRMSLYEQEFGYTYLRVFTHGFMIFIFVILIATLIKACMDKFLLLKSYIVVALIAYLLMNYFNVDAFIAYNNIGRFEADSGKMIDINYLYLLSDDAVPYMVKLLDNPNEQVSLEIKYNLLSRKTRLASKNDWQSFNLSEYRAKGVLDGYDLE